MAGLRGDGIGGLGLVTDLYELTMAAAYFEDNLTTNATFELFVRSLPPQRGFLVAAGLEQGLDYLEHVHFGDSEIEYLRQQEPFQQRNRAFFEYLKTFRFTGDVWAVREGTPIFGEEPFLRITAPIIEAQIVETFLLSTLTFQTMVASKAARMAGAAQGRSVVEFGSRRAHGPEAGVLAARAAYIGGCAGTSNAEAGRRFTIPTFGTQAHSFVMVYPKEEDAFRKFQEIFPNDSVLVVDTYNTLRAIDKIVDNHLHPAAIRLDSGDLVGLSLDARRRLNRAGLTDTKVFASGDLDEYVIADLLARGAPLDAFGVGTALVTSNDAPALGGVYKLVAIEANGTSAYRAKFSDEKITYPGRKQVYRFHDKQGNFREDIIAGTDEQFPDAEPLLRCVMRNGKRLQRVPDLAAIRQAAHEQIERLPEGCRRLTRPDPYPATFSERLEALLRLVRQTVTAPAQKRKPRPAA